MGQDVSPSPFDIWHIICDNGWLLGAVLAVAGAALECVGLILQKKAQYKLMGDKLGPSDPKPSWKQLMGHPLFWLGLILYVARSPVNMLALKYAPETTTLPLKSFVVLMNFFLSFGVLYERFTRRDITATLVCIVGVWGMNVAESRSMPGHLEDFPVQEVVKISQDVLTNEGFASYMIVWVVLFCVCLYVISFVSVRNVAKPLAVPVLIGLLSALFHFLSKIMVTLLSRSDHDQVWEAPITERVIVFTVMTYIFSLYAMCAGLQMLSCRFIIPAMFVATQALTATQNVLFFRAWESMDNSGIVLFVASLMVSLMGVLYIRPEGRVLASPDASGLNSPLLPPNSNAIDLHECVTGIIDEYKVRKPEATSTAELKTIDMSVPFRAVWKLMPICICVGCVLLPTLLWIYDKIFAAFTVLTIFSVYQGWKMGAHIALFAYVGTKKMAHFENADFLALHRAEMKEQKSQGINYPGRPTWEDVVHFVGLPNYEEQTEVLRLAIQSIAKSGIAKKHICLVLAMEAREVGAEAKANKLAAEFKDQFRAVFATYHPPGLPGEVPGKSANTKWAAEKIIGEFIPQMGVERKHCILTVGDADSEFHAEYFAGLSYYFLNAGGAEGETPDRYLTIWQPPILHFKNYVSQPAVVRLASFITSEHELSNLADPNATRVPYSTYSISAELVVGVNGWDPDFISEDWHMALKCFFATAGRLRVTPIFLPILNYAPEGDTIFQTLVARWVQAKRHALGFSELVYIADHFPRVFASISDSRQRTVFVWRLVFLWVKLLMIHVFMAVFFVIAPLNGVLIAYFAHNELTTSLTVNSWTFLINCVFQAIGIIAFGCVFLDSVLLYEFAKNRIDDTNKVGILWQSRILHFLTVVPQSFFYMPVFFVVAGAAEWIAAVKTARTHKFHYDVALKKNLEGAS